ncbi:MAG: hypothetical protein WCN87_00655 [Chlamydiota bacterium]
MLDNISSNRVSLDTLIRHLAAEDDCLALSALKDRSTEMKHTSAERKEWRALQIEKLKEVALHAKELNGWSFFSQMLQYLTGAFSLIAGAALVGTGAGAIAGSALIITGALTLSSQICQETGITRLIAEKASSGDPKKTEQLLAQIDLGLTISSIVLSMATALISTAYITNIATKALMGGVKGFSAGAEGIAAIGQGTSESRKVKASASVGLLQAKIESRDRRMQCLKEQAEDALSGQDLSPLATHLDSKAKRIQILFQQNQQAAGG